MIVSKETNGQYNIFEVNNMLFACNLETLGLFTKDDDYVVLLNL